MEKQKLVIIGSGPAGLSAAIYAARADLAPLVLEGSQPGGQLTGTTLVENFSGFPEGIMGPTLMNEMRKQAQKFGAKTEFKVIDRVDFSDSKNLKLFAGTEEIQTQSVIIATGSSARWLDLKKGEEKYWGRGYTACATCDAAFFRNKVVAVFGGGDTACEEATFLTKFATKVYLIYRGEKSKMRASLPMQERVFANEKIETLWNKNITDLRGEPVLKNIELTDAVSGEKSELPIDGLFMAIGHSPNTKFLGDAITLDQGYIKTFEGTQTNVPSVFAAGDVVDHEYQQAIIAAGSGAMAALDVQKYLAKD